MYFKAIVFNLLLSYYYFYYYHLTMSIDSKLVVCSCSVHMEQPIDLVNYVHNTLAKGVPLKRISEALNISDPRPLKRLMSKALGRRFRVFDSFTVDEVSEKIEALIPIREHGANWGILHV